MQIAAPISSVRESAGLFSSSIGVHCVGGRLVVPDSGLSWSVRFKCTRAEVCFCVRRDEVEMEMEEQPSLIGGSKPKERRLL